MLNKNQAYFGDYCEIIKDIPDASIDMVLIDPPFGITDCEWDKSGFSLDTMWTELKRVIKPTGVIAAHSIQPFTTDLIVSNRKWFKYNYIWIKSQAANFQLAKKMPLKKHEEICIFYNKKPTYNPQMWKGKMKAKRIGKNVYQKRKSDMFLSSKPANLEVVMSDMYHPTTILQYPGVARNKSLHRTQKPVALEEFLIKTYTNPGDCVLDPTAGSGTTAVAAKKTGRDFIVIEREKNYYDVMLKRIENET